MKKFLSILIMLLILPFAVNAQTGVSVNTKSLTVSVGGTTTFAIKGENCAGNILVNNSNKSIASTSISSTWIENQTINVTVKGLKVGTNTITVVIDDVASFDEKPITGSYKITVNVVSATTTTTKATTTALTRRTSTTTTSTKNIKNNTTTFTTKKTTVKTTSIKETTTTTKNETVIVPDTTTSTTTENVIDPVEITTNIINKPLYLNELEIVGYDLNFSYDKYEYDINIDPSVEELYIIAKTNLVDTKIYNDGKINIKGVESFKVSVEDTKSNSIKEYTIYINRNNNIEDISISPKTDEDTENAINMSLILNCVLSVLVLFLIVYIVINKKRSNKFYN